MSAPPAAPLTSAEPLAAPIVRDPRQLLEQTLRGLDRRQDLWVFGYASLIWNPDLEHSEQRPAGVRGYHRALKMWSRINRGTPATPGLVFALVSGGACRGRVFRVPAAVALRELDKLWLREMPTGVYDPRWLPCDTPQGSVRALAFTLSRRSPNFTGQIEPQQLVRILREAQGRYGSTLDYVQRTHECLLQHGIRDAAVAEVLRLARAHGLTA